MSIDPGSRFFRPADIGRLRRNQRRIQLQRVLVLLRTGGLLATVVIGGFWAWRHTQSDARFAVRNIRVEGPVHTPRKSIENVTAQYAGMNLFQIDLARVQRDLGGLGWVRRIDIEKTIPDTLRIKITERVPVALVRSGDRLLYVDDEGVTFAELSPNVGDGDLPLIDGASGTELRRAVDLLLALRKGAPEIYSRVSEVRPIPPRGFALYDRQLHATVYANREDVAAKWRGLYAVLAAERNQTIEYADLRFADRLIVKPSVAASAAGISGASFPEAQTEPGAVRGM
jgi:cell division protein FtsQ